MVSAVKLAGTPTSSCSSSSSKGSGIVFKFSHPFSNASNAHSSYSSSCSDYSDSIVEACDCDHLSSPLFTFRKPLNDFCRLSHFVSCNPTSAPWHIWYPPPPLGIRQNDFCRLGTFLILQERLMSHGQVSYPPRRLLSHGHVSYPPVPTSVAWARFVSSRNDFRRYPPKRLLSLGFTRYGMS